MKKFIKFFLGKKFGQGFYRFLFLAGLKGMNFGGGSDFGDSGEKWVLEYFLEKSGQSRPVVFDVGANLGGYSLMAAQTLRPKAPGFSIYAFEPSVKTFGLLQNNLKLQPEVKIFNSALGKQAGSAELYSNEVGSGLASLYQRDLEARGMSLANKETVKVETLDEFCAQNNVAGIDFLKLDVEGNEYNVLLGSGQMLRDKKIHFIQFEFGGTDIDARVYFKDFFNLLNIDYYLYRILKNGLAPITNYDETHEIFLTTNYLAELKK